jgi:hypothetical protein
MTKLTSVQASKSLHALESLLRMGAGFFRLSVCIIHARLFIDSKQLTTFGLTSIAMPLKISWPLLFPPPLILDRRGTSC